MAEQVGLRRPVAIKLLLADVLRDPEQVDRFVNEARITASITHPNVITILDHGAETGIPWIAYEYIHGRSLRQTLEASGGLDLEEAVQVGIQVCDALEAAHAKGVWHRDIKPDNVLEVGEGRYKVTDFGIAKWTQATAITTRTGVILGTAAYLSPELIRGDGEPSAASDIYALGVTLFEVMTGNLPFQDENPILLLERHLTSPIPLVSDNRKGIPKSADRIICKSMAKSPKERYSKASHLRSDLEAAIGPSARQGLATAARQGLVVTDGQQHAGPTVARRALQGARPAAPSASTRLIRLDGRPDQREVDAGGDASTGLARRKQWIGISLAIVAAVGFILAKLVVRVAPGSVNTTASASAGSSQNVRRATVPTRRPPPLAQWSLISDKDIAALSAGGRGCWDVVDRLHGTIDVHVFDVREMDQWYEFRNASESETAPHGRAVPSARRTAETLILWRTLGLWLDGASNGEPVPLDRTGDTDPIDAAAEQELARCIGRDGFQDSAELAGCALAAIKVYPDRITGWLCLASILEQERLWRQAARARMAGIEVQGKVDSTEPDRPPPEEPSLALVQGGMLINAATAWRAAFRENCKSGHMGTTPQAQQPEGRDNAAMAYDSVRGCTVLFGGNGIAGDLDDTWEWDGKSWRRVMTPISPPARRRHSLAYDAHRHRLVLFGGYSDASRIFGDTWEYDGSTWIERLSRDRPRPRQGAALVYASARGRTVLFGGQMETDSLLNDTWEWDGVDWQERKPQPSPRERCDPGAYFDEHHACVFIVGGLHSGQYMNDVWAWNGHAWQDKPAAPEFVSGARPCSVYDPNQKSGLLLAGGKTTEMWAFDGNAFRQIVVPPGRFQHRFNFNLSAAYDVGRKQFIVFGGADDVRKRNDLQAWDGKSWSVIVPNTSW